MSSLDELEVVITAENLSTNGAVGEVLTGIGGGKLAMAPAGAPAPHAPTHESGGSDEIDVGGLSGVLADAQTAAAHAASHAAAAGDAVPVESLPTAGAAGTSPVSVGGTLVMLPRGRLVNVGFSALASDVTTTSAALVVLHSFSYTKLSATSALYVLGTTSLRCNTSGAFVNVVLYHGATNLHGGYNRMTPTGANFATYSTIDQITGLGTGAVTIGTKWAVNTSTLTLCTAATNPTQEHCNLFVMEYEP